MSPQINFKHMFYSALAHMLTAPAFAGAAAGLGIGLSSFFYERLTSDIFALTLIAIVFGALFAYPVGFIVAALTGAAISVIQPSKAYQQGLWTAGLSCALAKVQFIAVDSFKGLQDLAFDVGDLSATILASCIFGGYVYGHLFYKLSHPKT
ncbi:MAG: hypothetical protein ACRCV6_06280 [Formosimonas sp.]